MFKYFVRYEYSYVRKCGYWEDSSGESIKETDTPIISTEKELDNIYEVQDNSKRTTQNANYIF